MRMDLTGHKKGGRYPRGYGLPALVVVLLLVSVLVSRIADAVARETVEARAAAAMSGVEERLQAFEVTGGDGTGLLPHLTQNRDVSLSLAPAAFGRPAEVRIEPSFRNGAETSLFDQKLRVFLNLPTGVPIGTLTPDTVRRKHPERVLRSGDRMGSLIDMSGDPAAPASVKGVGETRSGTGLTVVSGQAGRLLGPDGSLFEARSLTGNRVHGDAVEVSATARSATGSVANAVVTPTLRASSVQSTGLMRGRDSSFPDTRVSGTFSTESLDEQDLIYFDQVNVAGLRSTMARTNGMTATQEFGPTPGHLGSVLPPVTPEVIFVERP